MPLSAAKTGLYNAVFTAFKDARDVGLGMSAGAADAGGTSDNTNSDAALIALAQGLSDAIHNYATKADVDIMSIASTCPPGIVVVTAGSPFAQIGCTVMPIVTIHPTFGKLR